MAEGATAGATPLLPALPSEIVIWEILVRLPPICILRCRAVCRSWRRVASNRDFLLAHHDRQPSVPVVCEYKHTGGHCQNILAFHHRAADAALQPVFRLDDEEVVEASCDGLLILSFGSTYYSVCNPATRQHAPLWRPPDFRLFILLGMYLHPPTGEYRLLLYRMSNGERNAGHVLPQPEGKIGCYIFTLGSDQPLRYIGGAEAARAACFDTPALVRGSLHWSPVKHRGESRLILVFHTTAESFRQIHAPSVPTESDIFEMNDTLGIYSYNDSTEIVEIWVLQNYDGEVWEYKYRVELPDAEIWEQLGRRKDEFDVTVVSADGDLLLLITHDRWLFYVDTDGQLVDSFLRDGKHVYACQFRLKQTLVLHDFFAALEGYAVNTSPFI